MGETDPVPQNPEAKKDAPSAPANKYVGTPAVGTSKAAAAAFEVPTAGVPTYLLAGALGASFFASGFCGTGSVSPMSSSCLVFD